MKSLKYVLLTTGLLVIFSGCSSRTYLLPSEEARVNDIISQMPADSSQDRDQLADRLVSMNPGTAIFLSMKLDLTNDPNENGACYGLSAMTDYAARPGAEAERKVHAEALVRALEMVSNPHTRAFLISQLRLVGKAEAVRPLSKYLNDDFLCDYAAGALLTIGAEDAESIFLEALDDVSPAARPTIIKALGELQSLSAASKISEYTASPEPATRQVALYALANIGDPASAAILEEACRTGDAYEQVQNTSLCLRYARQLAKNGHLNLCAEICSGLISRPETPPHLQAAASSTLQEAVGSDHDAAAGIQVPPGFVSLFNGSDLDGWKMHDGLPGEEVPTGRWFVENGAIVGVQDPPGQGGFLATEKKFRDFELMLETKIDWPFDSGVFLRVGPDGKSHQVTLDYRDGAEIGGIYCPWTQGYVHYCPEGIKHFQKDQWNRLRITCRGEPAHIRVWLNDELITDFQHTAETTAGIPEKGTICLQVHPGGEGFDQGRASFRNLFIRSLEPAKSLNVLTDDEKAAGYVSLFNGRDLSGWVGALDSYGVKDGVLFCRKNTGRNIYTEKQYGNFILRFEFKLEPGTNNGLGIRTPLEGDAAYVGMELQILDDTSEKYSNLNDWQYHGSIYGVVPAKRGFLRPVGEWNFQEVIADGPHITVNLNGATIVDADIEEAFRNGTLDVKQHPGLLNKIGHVGFLGHGDYVEFRNIRMLQLEPGS